MCQTKFLVSVKIFGHILPRDSLLATWSEVGGAEEGGGRWYIIRKKSVAVWTNNRWMTTDNWKVSKMTIPKRVFMQVLRNEDFDKKKVFGLYSFMKQLKK